MYSERLVTDLARQIAVTEVAGPVEGQREFRTRIGRVAKPVLLGLPLVEAEMVDRGAGELGLPGVIGHVAEDAVDDRWLGVGGRISGRAVHGKNQGGAGKPLV